MNITNQLIYLFVLAIPVACISWTVTHEEIFGELREYLLKRHRTAKTIAGRKFFYLFICEYCFSHYVSIFILAITHYTLLFKNWPGYIIAGFSLVWIANIYMSLYGFIRTGLKKETVITKKEEQALKKQTGTSDDSGQQYLRRADKAVDR